MFLYRQPVKILYKSKRQQDILRKLSDYVDSHLDEPVEILARLWKDQSEALSYREIREAILAGDIDQETFEAWQQDYSIMAAVSFVPIWMAAVKAGGQDEPVTGSIKDFTFSPVTNGVRKWVREHSGELITAVTEEQRNAIRAMIGRAVDGRYTVDELSRVIRPCVGLNRPQAEANLRYYETVRDNLLKQHPRMKVESAQKQAREMAVKYAERQHRQRAYMIAETGLVSAYNQGNAQAVQQAQEQGALGDMRRIGSTADDERVCRRCAEKNGQELPADLGTPPWHPRCRCAIAYEPTGEPYIGTVPVPEYLPPMDEHITAEAQEQIWKEWDLIPEAHQDILKNEMDIWRSPFGNSRTDKRFGLVYMADELDEGEFIHEAAHILEEKLKVFEDSEYLKILEDSIGRYLNTLTLDTETFVLPVYRVLSPKLVTPYQGRYYNETSLKKSNGDINPHAFSDFFTEGYKAYILFPETLRQKNKALYDYMGRLALDGQGNRVFRDTAEN